MENKLRLIPIGNDGYIVKHGAYNKLKGVTGVVEYIVRNKFLPDNQDTVQVKTWLRSCTKPNTLAVTEEIFWTKETSKPGEISIDWIVKNSLGDTPEECYKYPDHCGFPWNSKRNFDA